jgi:hypothetical protein
LEQDINRKGSTVRVLIPETGSAQPSPSPTPAGQPSPHPGSRDAGRAHPSSSPTPTPTPPPHPSTTSPKGLAQVEAMREQVTRFNGAKAEGDNAGLMRVKLALDDILEKCMKDVDKDKEDGLAPDVVETWKNHAYEVVKEAVQFLLHLEEGGLASQPDDRLGPLRGAIEAATHLAESVTKEVQDPSEERLRDLARKLGAARKEIMAMSRSLMVGQSASLAMEAHRLVNDAGEVIKSSRETIKAALRGLGVASDISEVNGPTRALRPPPTRPVLGSLNAEWATGSQSAASAWPPLSTPATTAWPPPEPAPRPRMAGASSKLTALMQGLMGAQANDSRWPTFSGKYVEYPRFRKEWWAYRQTYHGHLRDEFVCRSLKGKEPGKQRPSTR